MSDGMRRRCNSKSVAKWILILAAISFLGAFWQGGWTLIEHSFQPSRLITSTTATFLVNMPIHNTSKVNRSIVRDEYRKSPYPLSGEAVAIHENFSKSNHSEGVDSRVVGDVTKNKTFQKIANLSIIPQKVVPAKIKNKMGDLSRRFPRVMIVGFGKTGTKAIFTVLKMHPDLQGPQRERRFFSDHYDKGLRYYLTSLPEPKTRGVVIEKSPDYIINEPAPSRIAASAKSLGIRVEDLKFIVVLRDPIDRAMSQYLEWKVSRRVSQASRLPPFHVMALRTNGTVNGDQPFIRASNYAKYIKHWYRYFNRTQTCFVDGDRFITDPYSEMHLLEGCLQLRSYFTSSNFVYNPGRGFYCFKESKNQLKASCMNSSKGRTHPQIPVKVFGILQSYFQPFNNDLPMLTGRTMKWQLPGS